MQTVFAFLVVLGALVAVHEFGHFLVARWCGVNVLVFSLGFGPALWRRRTGHDGMEWVISAIPLGGYVRMLDEREAEVAEFERHRAFNRQTVWRRSLIVAAGPLANFGLAVMLYWLIGMIGSPDWLPMLGTPIQNSSAAQAGVVEGELVTAVNGQAVTSWGDVRWAILEQLEAGGAVTLDVVNEQQERRQRHLHIAFESLELDGRSDPLQTLGLVYFQPGIEPRVGKAMVGSVAERAGMMAGDVVVAVDGQPVRRWQTFVSTVRSHPGQLLNIDLLRQGMPIRVSLTPDASQVNGVTIGRIGVVVDDTALGAAQKMELVVRYGPLEALGRAMRETWDKTRFSFRMFGRMLLGEVSWRNLSGPVTIADYAGQSARIGLVAYLQFMALLSISLGTLNLLPIPVLDGGHLMYHMIEVVRGRSLSEKALERSQRFGMAVLLTLMAFAFFNDLSRLFSG